MSSPYCVGGTVQELGGLEAYVTGPSPSKLAIILISDVFGYETPIIRKVADRVGAAGFLAVAPDLLFGDYYDLDNPQFDQESWAKAHTAEKSSEDTIPQYLLLLPYRAKVLLVSDGEHTDFVSGTVAMDLASSSDIQAVVLLHPGPITNDAIGGAEFDKFSTPEQLKQFGETLSLKSEFESCVKIYGSMTRGWTVWYKVEDELAAKRAEEAHQDMNWFNRHI